MSKETPKYDKEEKPDVDKVNCSELLINTTLELEALIRILERKGMTSTEEVAQEMNQMRAEIAEMLRKLARGN